MDFNKIITELCWRLEDGTPDFNNPEHLQELRVVLTMHKWDTPAINELIETLTELKFKDKAAYVAYRANLKTGKMRPTTKVTIGGKDTTAGEADGEEGESEEEPENDTKKTPDEAYESAKEKVKELYGEDGSLLQDSETSDAALKNGYKKGADWVAPGNAGSNFNENMSNEAALIIGKYPDINETELAAIIFEKTKNTELGKQQKSTTVESPSKGNKGEIPSSIKSKKEKDLFRSSVIAARSGITKSKRATKGTKLAQEKVGFGKETKTSSFGGTTKDLENLKNKINSAKKIYIVDNGKVIEIPKESMQEWVAGSGGGENASDTAVITEDENGNLIYDGWSDKKGFNDIQGNSTLNDDYTKQTANVDSLEKTGRVTKKVAAEAKQIIEESKNQSAELEKNYEKASFQEGAFLGTYEGEDKARLVEILKKQSKGYEASGTTNHIENAMKFHNVETHEELLDKLAEEAKLGKSSGDRQKVISRMAAAERTDLKANGKDIPDGLDTNKIISNAREKALALQKEAVNRLNKLSGTTQSGKEKPLGELVGFQETIDFLHLDKIQDPKDDSDVKQILKRNTQLVMAGEAVTPENIKKCLGVSNLNDAEDNFKVVLDEEKIQNAEKTMTTGKIVYIYAIDQKDNSRKHIGVKRYRSKGGKTGKTSNTIQWSPSMQKCFDS